jgi:hypothetical protein
VVTGGGYNGNGAFSAFRPSGNGWQGQPFGGAPTTVYAICASGNLALSSTPSEQRPIIKGQYGGAPIFSCPTGQLLVGGRYTLTPPAVAFEDAGSQPYVGNALPGWIVEASDRSFGSMSGLTVTAIGVCATLG